MDIFVSDIMIRKVPNARGVDVIKIVRIMMTEGKPELISTFDKDGYPTDETLECVAALDPTKNDPEEIVKYLSDIWHWGGTMLVYENGCLGMHTGGWSGNESIITALEKSFFWMVYWFRSERGGHYWFKVKRP